MISTLSGTKCHVTEEYLILIWLTFGNLMILQGGAGSCGPLCFDGKAHRVLTGALLHMKITSASVPSAVPDRRWGIRMVSLCKKQVCRQELLISGRPASILERASQKPLRKFMGLQRVPFRRFSRMNFIFTLFSAHYPSCDSRMSTVLCIIVKR